MIQIIDLNGDFTSRSEEGRKLREACSGLGCFRVVNHGIPFQLMADIKSLAADLFHLPPKLKRKNLFGCPGIGFIPPTDTNPLSEALGIFEAASGSTVNDVFCSRLQLSPLQRKTIDKYGEAIYNVTMDVANKLAKSMGVESDHLFEGWSCVFRINKYHFEPETVGSLGVQMHTDSGFLTVLQDDENVGGLEVKDLSSGEFVAVDPLPGSLVVNLGDTGVIWSNGRLRNVQHRVMCKEARRRYSIATSIIPPRDMMIEVPQEFVDAEHPRLHSSVTCEELRRLRDVNEFYAGEVLDLLRVGN